jgi:hypothetical protein
LSMDTANSEKKTNNNSNQYKKKKKIVIDNEQHQNYVAANGAGLGVASIGLGAPIAAGLRLTRRTIVTTEAINRKL